MNRIKTPFGEIDLDVKPINFWITDSTLGAKRKVQFEGIKSMTEQGQYAQIVWHIYQYDKEEQLLNELDAVQARRVITPVSGQNRVTADGILIDRQAFPEGAEGQEAFQKAFDAGYNEYQYWMALLRVAPLPTVITAAGQLLAQFERFDRE